MRNLKIAKKLLVAFGTIIVLFIISTTVSLSSIYYLGHDFMNFFTVSYPVSKTTAVMRMSTEATSKLLSLSVLSKDTASRQS